MRRILGMMVMALLLAALVPWAQPAAAQGSSVAEITAAALNVRAGPGTSHAVLGVTRRGERWPVLGQSGGWVQIDWKGKQGWVSGSYVRLTGGSASSGGSGQGGSAPAPASGSGKLVFATSPGGALYTVNADGSNLRRLGAVGLDPAWSPTGDRIAFADWNPPRGIYVVRADGSGRNRVFDWELIKAPAWSPDGNHIAFSFQKGGRLEEEEFCFFGYCFTLYKDPFWWIGAVDLRTGELSEPLSEQHSYSPVWRSPTEILYTGERGLKIAYTDRNEEPGTLVRDTRITDPRLCEAAGKLASTYYQHDHWEIYTLNSNGGGKVRLTGSESVMAADTGQNVAPEWSPDCSQIVFLSNRDGRWRPYIMNADGSNQRPFLPQTFDALTFDYGFSSDRVFDWTR